MTFYLMHLILGFFASISFAVLFHVPKKHLVTSGLVGGMGWTVFVGVKASMGAFIAGFAAACFIGLLADICARKFHQAATVYIIPGIICLVPGAGMYYTTLYLINGEMSMAADKCVETLMMAGCISVGLLIEESIFRIGASLPNRGKKKNIF